MDVLIRTHTCDTEPVIVFKFVTFFAGCDCFGLRTCADVLVWLFIFIFFNPILI